MDTWSDGLQASKQKFHQKRLGHQVNPVLRTLCFLNLNILIETSKFHLYSQSKAMKCDKQLEHHRIFSKEFVSSNLQIYRHQFESECRRKKNLKWVCNTFEGKDFSWVRNSPARSNLQNARHFATLTGREATETCCRKCCGQQVCWIQSMLPPKFLNQWSEDFWFEDGVGSAALNEPPSSIGTRGMREWRTSVINGL